MEAKGTSETPTPAGATSVISRMLNPPPPTPPRPTLSAASSSSSTNSKRTDNASFTNLSYNQPLPCGSDSEGPAGQSCQGVMKGPSTLSDTIAAAAAATTSSVEPPRYHRLMIDGDEGDKDYLKCVGLIAHILQARETYKSMDRGQKEILLTPEEVEQRLRDVVEATTKATETVPATTAPPTSNTSETTSEEKSSAPPSNTQATPNPATETTTPSPQSLDTVMRLTNKKGVYTFAGMHTTLVPWSQYVSDIVAVFGAIENGPCLSTGRTRVTAIAEKFRLYSLLNQEIEGDGDTVHRDGGLYAPCTRVDNHVRMQTSVVAPVLLDYIITTALEQPTMPLYVDQQTQRTVTLADYLAAGGIHDPRALTVEGLGLHPTLYRNKYLPYDMFDAKLNPAGEFGATLLQAVLSTDGPNHGNLCGMLLRAELEWREYEVAQATAAEMALEVHGYHPEEVPRLAAWVHRQGFNRFARTRWTLTLQRQRLTIRWPNQLPDVCSSVGEQLRNIFHPLFMATLCPQDPAWVDVAELLLHTGAVGLQTHNVVRAENFNKAELDPNTVPWSSGNGSSAPPSEQPDARRVGGCSDYYFFYYVWANLATLNALRTRLGLNTFLFTPTVHEHAPAYDQLVCSYLLGDVVHNVSSLSKSWIMQFLYLYSRIGIVLSPLRDNALSTGYFDHPVVRYFHQGMRVSLSTADPLYFHHNELYPLMEEYATLCKIYSLSPMDTMELARNSVLNSSFPEVLKQVWIGRHATALGADGNDLALCGVGDCRLQFRHETLAHEEELLNRLLVKAGVTAKPAPDATAPVPLSVHLIPHAQAVLVSDLVQQSRHHSRRMNYTDQRIVYPRIDIYHSAGRLHSVAAEAVQGLRQAIIMRRKYAGNAAHTATAADADVRVEDVFRAGSGFDEAKWEYNSYYGVCILSQRGTTPTWPSFLPPITEFMRDMAAVRQVASAVPLQRLAAHRLNLLAQKFLLHLSMNISNEAGRREDKEYDNRDFFTAYKVDTNVHTDAGSNARTLLEFFVDKAMHHGDDVVYERDHHPITLTELLTEYAVDVEHVTVDDLHHHLNTRAELRSIFLSPFNFMHGRYFAELTKRTLSIYEEDAFSFAENRLTISGASEQEWYDLASWFDCYGMASSRSRWMISLPWQYRRLRRSGALKNFGEFLDHVFHPLWEVSLHPAKDSKFHYFLTHVSGFDCVADESKIDLPLSNVAPHEWRSDLNPPYSYYMYYMWANLTTLNEFRASRGLNTFTLRPQCGERGGIDHLVTGFCLANSINHGVTLARHPVLEYMWYIAQVGVAMSPLSNTAGASAYLENPFPVFFHRGLNVSLATNKPLYFHFTREPLVEEYSIAAKLWKFEPNDLSEIARNSALQSGFPAAWKEQALGARYHLRSTLGNDVRRSRVSDIRVAYRYEAYHTELNFLDEQLAGPQARASSATVVGEGPKPVAQRMPRAMKLLEEELAACGDVALVTFLHRLSATSPSAASRGRSAEGAEGTARPTEKDFMAPSFESSAEVLETQAVQLRREITQLDAELHRMQSVSMQIAGENNSIAAQVNELRGRLEREGLSILGGLQHPPAGDRE